MVAALRLLFVSEFPTKNHAWLIFCAAICISILTGLVSYGSTAGVQARAYFYFMVAGLYGMSFPMDEKRLRLVFNAYQRNGILFRPAGLLPVDRLLHAD